MDTSEVTSGHAPGYCFSAQQRRLWAAGTPTIFPPLELAFRITRFDPARLRHTLAVVAARHSILRTQLRKFPLLEAPRQVVELEWKGCARGPDPGCGGACLRNGCCGPQKACARAGAFESIDCEPGPDGSVDVRIRFRPTHVDWESLHLFFTDFRIEYDGRTAGNGETAIQYGDFAEWQHAEWLPQVRERAKAYWQAQPQPMPPRLPFPTSIAPTGSRYVEIVADEKLVLPSDYGEEKLLTAGMAAMFTTLFHYSGGEQTTVITRLDGRFVADLRDVLGVFENFAPVTLPVSSEVVLDQLLEGVAHALAELRARQELVLDEAVNCGWSEHVLFEVAPTAPPLDESPVAFVESHRELRRFKLRLVARSEGQKVALTVGFDSGALAEEDVRNFFGVFRRALQACLHASALSVGRLALMPSDQLSRIERCYCRGGEAVAAALIPQRITEWARTQPDRIALTRGLESVSYGALMRRSGAMGAALRRSGAGPERLVLVHLESSPDAIVAIMAVLLSGAGYAPVDFETPDDRLAVLVRKIAPAVIITTALARSRFAAFGVPVFAVDDKVEAPEEPLTEPVRLHGANVAYCIFTSGSTGHPKGVLVSHASLALSTDARFRVYPELPRTFLLLSPLVFDSSVAGLFWTLAAGGTVVLPAGGGNAGTAALSELMGRHAVTHLLCVPILWRILLEHIERAEFASLQAVIVAGESLPSALLDFHATVLPAVPLYNEYGPTEGTVWCTVDISSPGRVGLIGFPIPGANVGAIGAGCTLLPFDLIGELYLGGAGVARGYLREPGQTAERFVPTPLPGSAPGERAYRTGDYGRMTLRGIQFTGRADNQVKIRGFRVELEEIEIAFTSHLGVRAAAVCLVGSDRKLKAWVQPADVHSPITAETMREHVARRLPAYMIPGEIRVVSELPRLPNGKIDRRLLAASYTPAEAAVDSGEDARDPIEQVLARIWADFFKRPRIGRSENYLALGGDSIGSIQLASRIRRAGYQAMPKDFFEHPSIAQLAAALATRSSAMNPDSGSLIDMAPLTPIQHWFMGKGASPGDRYTQSILLAGKKSLDLGRLQRAFQDVVARHDALRLGFRMEGGQWIQTGRECPPAMVAIEVATLTDASKPAEWHMLIEQLRSGFSIREGRLIAVAQLPQLRNGAGGMLIVIHHLLVDAVSWSLILPDVEVEYQALAEKTASHLAPTTASYLQWAAYLNRPQTRELFDSELEFWSRQVSPASRGADSGDLVLTPQGHQIEMDAELTALLLARSGQGRWKRLEDVFIAAVIRSAGFEESGCHLLLERHGRDQAPDWLDLSRTVGWFTALFPLRIEGVARGSPGALLAAVATKMQAVPSGGIGFGVLKYLSERPAVLAEGRYDIGFNYLGDISAESSLLFDVEPMPAADPSGPAPECAIAVIASISDGRIRFALEDYRAGADATALQTLGEGIGHALREFAAGSWGDAQGAASDLMFEASAADLQNLLRKLEI